MSWYRFFRVLLAPIAKVIFPIRIYGQRKFSRKERLVIAINHLRWVDPVYLCANVIPQPHFWGKKELFKGRLAGWFLRKIGAIPLDREGQDLNAVKTALKLLNDNKVFALFPEGTRNTEDSENMNALRQGIAMLAIRTKSPIRLCLVHKKARFMRMNRMIIGAPFTLDEFYGVKATSEVLEKAMVVIETKFSELRTTFNSILLRKGIIKNENHSSKV